MAQIEKTQIEKIKAGIEDERIRKEIHAYLFNTLHNTQQLTPRTNELELWLAYLEKQKEKKLAESAALQKAFISSKTDYTLEEKCDASDYADAILPTSVADGENEEEYKLHKIIEAAFIAGRKKEQKPVHTAKEMWEEMRLEVYAQASGNRHEPNYSDDSAKMFSLCDIDEIFEKIGLWGLL